MLIQKYLPTQKKQCIKHRVFENLSIVPYIKGRLVFAETAARLIEEEDIDLVLVDLPLFMNDSSFLNVPVSLFPAVSSLIVETKGSSFMPFHFTPNHAPCAAVSLISILKMTGKTIDLHCIDDSNIIHYPEACSEQPAVNLKDDYFVFVEGIEAYFASAFQQLEDVWHSFSADQQFLLLHRAGSVAERLLRFLSRGLQTLFIVEYRLWWLLSKIISKEMKHDQGRFLPQWGNPRGALIINDPYIVWANKLLDDHPAIVQRFFQHLQLGTVREFDKLQSLNDVIMEWLSTETMKRHHQLSIRKLTILKQILNKTLVLSLRMTPALISDLYHAVYSCMGKKYAKAVAQLLLNYPHPNRNEIQRQVTIHEAYVQEVSEVFQKSEEDELLHWTHNVNERGDLLQGDQEACCDRIEFVQRIFPYISISEKKELKEGSLFRWAIEKDYKIHEIVCKEARQGAEIKLGAEIIRQSTGDCGDGIHWKSTIASWAKGEKEIYVRDRRYKQESSLRFDEYTPVVFLFTEDFTHDIWSTIQDSNITTRNIQLGNSGFPLEQHPPPDHVYSVCYTEMKREPFCYGHIIKFHLSSIVFLYSRHVMGTDRYKKIIVRPKNFQCRVTPTEDPELKVFSLSELGTAWAIKYAEKAVLVVARTGWDPSADLQLYAKEKGIKVIHIPISSLKPEMVERIRILYFISTPLKKHPSRDIILERFID